MTHYRYPNEHLILALTVALVLGVIAFTSVATLCGSAVFVLGMLALAYVSNSSHHDDLVRRAQPVTAELSPQLAALIEASARRLGVGRVQAFVAPSRALNAYTFGLGDPKVVVLYSGLLQVMDQDELHFIIGHEVGHIRLGHTWLNSVLGGMAGIPSPYGAAALLYFSFRWWNRACEFSADRAGLLACGRPEKAISALLKLAGAGGVLRSVGYEAALTRLEQSSDDWGEALTELVSTHPQIAKRIRELRRWAASDEYRRAAASLA